MSFLSRLWATPSPIPFHSDPDTPLLRLGSKDMFTLEDAARSVLVGGSSGAGKTSGAGNSLLRAYMRSGAGGLVPCVKNNFADAVVRIAKECGRERDIIRFSADSPWVFNFLEYTKNTLAKDGYDSNLAAALVAASEAARLTKAGRGGGDNPFFRDASEELLLHALPFLKVTQPRLQLRDLMRFIDSAPNSPEETKDETWQQTSFCAQTLLRCGELADKGNAEAERIAEELGAYWLQRWVKMGDKTRSSIVATLTSTLNGLMSGELHRLFCGGTNLTPEFSHEGAIIILDFSEHEYGSVGLIAQQIFKSLWMRSMEQRRIEKGMRRVFLWVDEAQAMVTEEDAKFLSVSREYGALSVYLTQDLEALKASMTGENADARVNQFIAKFGTLCLHSNGCPTTNRYGSEMIGKIEKFRLSKGVNLGRSNSKSDEAGRESGGGLNQGSNQSLQSYDDYDVPPEYFANKLRTGGKRNRYRVDAILIRSARPWAATGRNRLKVTFHQKAR